jgi:hypothetical protein
MIFAPLPLASPKFAFWTRKLNLHQLRRQAAIPTDSHTVVADARPTAVAFIHTLGKFVNIRPVLAGGAIVLLQLLGIKANVFTFTTKLRPHHHHLAAGGDSRVDADVALLAVIFDRRGGAAGAVEESGGGHWKAFA